MKQNTAFKRIMAWAGIIFTGACGIVLLGGDKIISGSLLIVSTVIMLLPVGENHILRKARIGLICVAWCFALWNISTTDLPGEAFFSPAGGIEGQPEEGYTTGIRFFDQVIHIFNGFLEGRLFRQR